MAESIPTPISDAMKHISPALAAVLVTLASCTSTTEPQAPSVILPLTVGNMWIGRATDYRPDTVRIRLDTIMVEKDTVIDGERRSLFNFQNGYLNRSDGAYFWALGPDGAPTLLYKYPAAAGDEVRYAFATGQGNDSIRASIRVLSTNEPVTVPAGTFICHHYYRSSNFGQYDSHVYLAPGVGFIKSIAIPKEGPHGLADSSQWELVGVTIR
jgi:hypothetical protein